MESDQKDVIEEDVLDVVDEDSEDDEGDLLVSEGSKRVVMEPKDITIFNINVGLTITG